MLTLLVGFVGMVLAPALILSIILTRLKKNPMDLALHEENLRFKISPDIK